MVSRPFVCLLVASLVACKGSSKAKPAPAPPADAAPPSADARSAPAVDLSFVRGTVIAAAERDHRVVPLLLDKATGAWVALGASTKASLFPTGHVVRGGILAIATEGETQADHVEQLALLRGDAVELLGPRAGAVRNPTVSATGDVIVVETSENNFRDLYTIDAAGKTSRLTDNREGNFEPSLARDAQAVAFSSSRDGDAEIYRVQLKGGAATRLTAFHKDDWSPLWSPDDKHIAFLSDREGPPRLFLMSPDGTAQRRATAETDIDVAEDLPRWSPDGTQLAFVRGGGIHQSLVILDLATGATRTLTPELFTDSDFAWSPDGAHLVTIRTDVHVVRSQPIGDVVIISATDGKVVAPLGTAAGVRFVRWLP
jgi:TolB protein